MVSSSSILVVLECFNVMFLFLIIFDFNCQPLYVVLMICIVRWYMYMFAHSLFDIVFDLQQFFFIYCFSKIIFFLEWFNVLTDRFPFCFFMLVNYSRLFYFLTATIILSSWKTMTWLDEPNVGWPQWNICATNVHGYVPSVINTSRVCNYINTTGDTSGAGAAYPSRATEFTPSF